MTRVPTALTIAGSDSGGGAGIQADLKTFFALGVHGASAVTAITAQNTVEVTDVLAMPAQLVRAQIDTVFADLAVSAVKTGMLAEAEIVSTVADALSRHAMSNVVVDPVTMSSSGTPLLSPEAVKEVTERLFPLALVVTPNLDETEAIVGSEVRALEAMKDAAKAIAEMGPTWVLVKGGHLEGDAVDLLYNGEDFFEFSSARIGRGSAHGSGCTLSSAIAAYLALGEGVFEAVSEAKVFVTGGLANAQDVGGGVRPVNQRWMLGEASGGGENA